MADRGCMSEVIRDILAVRTRNRINNKRGAYRHAGVLVPLLTEDGECKVLFTERTHKVEHHKGQISFPGGGIDDMDPSIEATAIREAQEEIGVSPRDVEILGRLDDTLTLVSNYVIHPFVAMIRSENGFTINRDEVARIIYIPLWVFLCADGEDRNHWIEYEGRRYRTTAYEHEDHLIWGATGRIMENFGKILMQNLFLHPGKK